MSFAVAQENGECLEELLARYRQLNEENSQLQKTNTDLKAETIRLNNQLTSVNTDIENCSAKTTELTTERDGIKSDITDLFNEIADIVKEISELNVVVDNLESDIDSCNRNNDDITTRNKQLGDENDRLDIQIHNLSIKRTEVTTALVSCQNELQSTRDTIELKKTIKQNEENFYAALISKLRVDIENSINEKQTIVNNTKDALERLKEEIRGLVLSRNDLRDVINELIAEIERLLAAIKECQGCVLSKNFNLSLQYACRQNVALGSCIGQVYWNDELIYTITPRDYEIQNLSLQVIAKKGANSVKFQGSGVSDSYGLTIDNVELVRRGTDKNLLVNGGFENPSTNGGWTTRRSIEGWTGQGNNIEFGRGGIYNRRWNSQVVELDSSSNYALVQTVTLDDRLDIPRPLNNNFNLSFEFAAREGVGLDSNKGEIYWNGNLIYSINPSDYGRYKVNLQVQAVPGRNSIRVKGTGKSDSYGLTVDNFSLVRQGSSTNIVVNGSFEDPAVSGYSFFQSIPGWERFDDLIEIGKGTIYNRNWDSNVAELDGHKNYGLIQYFEFDNFFRTKDDNESITCPASNPFVGQEVLLSLRDAKKVHLESIKREIVNLQETIVSLNARITQIRTAITEIRNNFNGCKAETDNLKRNIAELEAEIQCRNEKIAQLSIEFSARFESINRCS